MMSDKKCCLISQSHRSQKDFSRSLRAVMCSSGRNSYLRELRTIIFFFPLQTDYHLFLVYCVASTPSNPEKFLILVLSWQANLFLQKIWQEIAKLFQNYSGPLKSDIISWMFPAGCCLFSPEFLKCPSTLLLQGI